MRSYRACITPLSAFGTPLKGDTLFGQLCCAVRNHYNVARLEALLDGYTSGHPFAVLSDAFPAGHLPRPLLPGRFYGEAAALDRKMNKKRVWLPLERFKSPVARWLEYARSASELLGSVPEEKHQPHNTLNRETGTTGEGMFVPYAMSQLWYGRGKSDRIRNDLIKKGLRHQNLRYHNRGCRIRNDLIKKGLRLYLIRPPYMAQARIRNDLIKKGLRR